MDSSQNDRSSVLSRYFSEIRAYPLLTKDQEHSLARNVKASGCPNGCSQHHLAAIGLQGSSFSANGATIPCFDIFLGGGNYIGGGKFATRIARVPSKRTPQQIAVAVRVSISSPASRM